jgi:hypothetical protein
MPRLGITPALTSAGHALVVARSAAQGADTVCSVGLQGRCRGSGLGHMPTGILGVYNLHRYNSERLEWLKKLTDRYEELDK